jgi:signal transduction histidine kinase
VSEGPQGARDDAAADTAAAGLGGEIDRRLHRLASLACAALPASACAIGWRLGPESGFASASRGAESGAAARAASMLDPLARLQAREPCPADSPGASSRILDPSGMAALGAQRSTSAAEVFFGGIHSDGESTACVVLAAALEAPESEIRALLELLGSAALREVGAVHLAASRRFWRSRATSDRAGDAVRLRQAGQCSELVADLQRLSTPERFRAMGDRVAASIGCGRWMVALRDGDALRIEAASAPPGDQGATECSREFADSIREGRIVTREPGGRRRIDTVESRLLGDTWTAIPFEAGALALGGALGPEARAMAEAMVAAAAPLVRAWIAERRLGEYRALVQRMALRMYAAIDDERARIARDLHDDQGQLLAAARLALQGKPEAARVIFEQLERELRSRTRELRPATLGKLSLGAALESDLARMRETGLDARLSIGAAVETAPLHVQQLCFQVAREALTNVMRHAGASSVMVSVERGDGALRIAIADNGRGIRQPPATRSSTGLKGITERLELMGGKLAVDSRRSGTRLVADIPVPL